MSKKPIDKDKLFFWTLLSCMIAIVVMMIVLFATQDIWGPRYRAEFYGEEWPPVTYTPVPTKSVEPTNAPESPEETPKATETPTAPAATDVPDAEPTKVLEETVTPTEPAEPTDKPVEPVTPDVTAVPEETVMPTVALTAIPTATSAPMPSATPVPVQVSEMTYKLKVGDNVYFEFYLNENVLIVTGTGATWNFESINDVGHLMRDNLTLSETVGAVKERIFTIIIEEGITGIGDYALCGFNYAKSVSVASTLTEIGGMAFWNCGKSYSYQSGTNTEWIGLDLNKLECETSAFRDASLPADVDGSKVQCTPTPTPIVTPTPIPIPDPNNPRLVASENMGNNVTFEFWDNGYLYVRGTGKIVDKDMFIWGMKIEKEFLRTLKYCVIEEGISYLGRNALSGIITINEFWFPETMVSIEWGQNYLGKGGTLHWYYEGKKVTVKALEEGLEFSLIYECLTGERSAEDYGLSIIWE